MGATRFEICIFVFSISWYV